MTKETYGRNNPGFVEDDGKHNNTYDKSKLDLEMTEKGQNNKQNVYNPYEHREVTHPTT